MYVKCGEGGRGSGGLRLGGGAWAMGRGKRKERFDMQLVNDLVFPLLLPE